MQDTVAAPPPPAPGTFDHFARLVCHTIRVPTGLVTLVEPDRQVFLGAQGLARPWQWTRQTPLSHSFCQYVVADRRPLVITDARLDSRLAGNCAITDLHVIAYAGWPLTDQGAQVTHDLQNPLSALSATLELIADLPRTQGSDHEEVGDLLARAQRNVRRMAELVHDVLARAVVGGGLVLRDIDVKALLGSVLDDLVGVRATLSVGDLPPAHADGVQLRILLQNLLVNAAKHAPGAPVEVAAHLTADDWVLEVVDHGPGIPLSERQRVMAPYVRLDPVVPGSGVGLATCRRIVDGHGGTMRLDETPGGGTTARVILPRHPGRR